jgi:hypothetical protein
MVRGFHENNRAAAMPPQKRNSQIPNSKFQRKFQILNLNLWALGFGAGVRRGGALKDCWKLQSATHCLVLAISKLANNRR